MFKEISGTATVITPIYHGGNEKTGSTPVLRTMSVWTDDGGKVIPYIHGNAVRGRLRRLIMKDFLEKIGYEIEGKHLYHSLFSGGTLESGVQTGTIDLSLRRKMQELIPPVSLFGGCFGNQILQGIMTVRHMFPVCKEYFNLLPDSLKDDLRAQEPVRGFTDESFITRKDDLRDREDGEQAIQMKVDYECLIPGTLLTCGFTLSYYNDNDMSCFARMINLWKQNPTVGGRSSSGDGVLSLNLPTLTATEDIYLNFIDEHKEQIIDVLKQLDG